MLVFAVLLIARSTALEGFGPMFVGDMSCAYNGGPAHPMASTAPEVHPSWLAAIRAANQWNRSNPSCDMFHATAVGYDPATGEHSSAVLAHRANVERAQAIAAAKLRHPSYVG